MGTILFFVFYLLSLEGEREEVGEGGERKRERERDINLLFHLFMYLLHASCMCSDQRLNP